MPEAVYHMIDHWAWECPDCGNWNEEEEDPWYQDTVICQNPECGHQFTPVQG